MADPGVVAVVFGSLPFLGILWYAARRTVAAHPGPTWGSLVGIVAFLAPGHAMASLLEDHGGLSTLAGEGAALALLVGGTILGLAAGAWLVGRPATPRISHLGWVAWGATLYLAIHSFADGLVLGETLVPGASPIPVDGITVSATVLHRFSEGSILVLPALLAGWRTEKALGLLAVGLLTVPGGVLAGSLLAGLAVVPFLALRSLATGAEAGLGLILIVAAFMPQALVRDHSRWIGWAAAAFLGILLLHGLVE